MTLAICEAISHPDMKRRRYAIGALGYIHDKRALPALEKILKDRTEIYYFRGDALHAIYQINKKLGSQYAAQFANEHDYLKRLAVSIQRREPWLAEPTKE
jgi:HEAT repeat protein